MEIYVRRVQRVTNQNIINIPRAICEHLAVEKGSQVGFAIIDGEVIMRRYEPQAGFFDSGELVEETLKERGENESGEAGQANRSTPADSE